MKQLTINKLNFKNIRIGIIGMGYVGLPLAIEFGKKFHVHGYDIKKQRIRELKKNNDINKDISVKEFKYSKYLNFTDKIKELKNCNIYIITVPTPIHKNKKPDLKLIKNACVLIGSILDKNNFVIFESTVYPGLTEEICIPILSKKSKLKLNKDFFCGYSPERINPNDKKHKLQNIVKITSGSNTYSANIVDKLYLKIIKAGTFKASNIKIAEAAKVIENTQRDLNIAFVNELVQIFNNLKIDTNEILKAANSKWNFLNFKPGLVGGHCIGVDPYYLTYKSKQKGYYPKIITAGRNINDNFPNYIFKKTLYETKKIFKTEKLRFLILGLTFKEDCVDYRNSKSIELVKLFKSQNHETHCFDPLIDIINFNKEYKFKINKKLRVNYYHCVIISVAHKIFIKQGEKKIRRYLINDGLIFDVKNIYPKNQKNIYL